LVWDDPAGWQVRFSTGPPGPVEVIDSDITTLTASADKVLKVGGPDPYLINTELQSYHDTSLARTLWYRQVALDYRHYLPVLTVLVLLCKEANSPGLTHQPGASGCSGEEQLAAMVQSGWPGIGRLLYHRLPG
jgi:hypothetical protein